MNLNPATTRRRDERGSITPFVLIVSLAIIALAALVIDGGRQLNAKGRAIAYAQEAARAGSQVVDVADPRLDLVPGDAEAAARAYCTQAIARDKDQQLKDCTPRLVKLQDPAGTFYGVEVTTHVEIPSILLDMFGKSTLTATGIALARPVSGTSEADQGKVPTVPPPSVGAPGSGGVDTEGPGSTFSVPTVQVTPCAPSTSPPSTTPPTTPPTTKPTKPSESTPPTTKSPEPPPTTPTPTLDPCKTPGP